MSSIICLNQHHRRMRGMLLSLILFLLLVPSASASTTVPNDPLFAQQTSLQTMNVPAAWPITTGAPLIVAVVDTGISPTHLDLKANLLPGYDLVSNDSDPRDDEGHGTKVAGLIAAVSNNQLGITGVCWNCRLLPIKVTDRSGNSNPALIAAGIRLAVDQGARIINVSLGVVRDTPELQQAIQFAVAQGVLVVAAAGNRDHPGNPPYYPAAYPGVLAVSALGQNQQPLPSSTSGQFVRLSAPGEQLISTSWKRLVGDEYATISGASAAAPLVSGAAALLWSVRPELRADQLADLLALTATDLGPPGRDPEYGFGLVHVARALQLAQASDSLQQAQISGLVRQRPAADLRVQLNDLPPQPIAPDGSYRFDQLPAGQYRLRFIDQQGFQIERTLRLNGTALSRVRLDVAFPTADIRAFQPVSAPNDPQVLFFPETGHTLKGAFRRFWEANGGLQLFGFPISEEFAQRQADGQSRVVQYFERHRLEYHPQNPTAYQVQLTRLGDLALQQRGVDWQTLPAGTQRPGCRYLAETRHTLCEPFLSAWLARGLELDGQPGWSEAEHLALFGLPLTEAQYEILDDGVPRLVQWFERARFEYHGDQGVLFGLLNREVAQAEGFLP